VTMLVFSLHAGLPAFQAYSAVSMAMASLLRGDSASNDDGDSDGWDRLHGISCLMLGLYSFCSISTRCLQDDAGEEEEYPEGAGMLLQAYTRMLRLGGAFARFCCVLAAWMYASLALDVCVTWLAQWFSDGPPPTGGLGVGAGEAATSLGVVGPLAWLLGAGRGASPLRSEKAVAFSLSLVSVISQQRLYELLGRREVLLRLIGAERVTASTLCLLLRGVSVALSTKTGPNPIADFLNSVAPPPIFCVLVVALRSQAVVLGTSLALMPRLACSGVLGSAPSLLIGMVAGAYAAHVVLHVWYTSHGDLDSPAMRLAILVPGSVSCKAKGLLRGAIAGVRTRAVQMMALGLLRRAMRWLSGR